ncbi:MAG TPA: hypothetical protein VIM59_06800 [Cellvibrio sp.]
MEHVHVIPMITQDVLPDRAIVIDDGKIIKIIKQADAGKINATIRINGEGRYLMPGLADMHVHVRWNPQAMFNLFLANGVLPLLICACKMVILITSLCVKKLTRGKFSAHVIY